jgi:hypothetical protein
MTRCKCGHLSDAHSHTNGVCLWRDCYCMSFEPDSETCDEQ